MKKNKIKALLLSLLTLSGILTSCGKKEEEKPTIDNTPKEVFMKNGYSDYSLLLSDKPMDLESRASQEFITFVKEATDMTIPVISEADVKTDTKYISLGYTKEFSNLSVDISSLAGTQSAYYRTMDDKGNLYFVASTAFRGAGVLYGIYDLLEEMVGYRYYASDEYKVTKSNNLSFYQYKNRFVRPSFDSRTVSVFDLMVNPDHCQRLRNIMPGSLGSGEWNGDTWGHGQIEFFVPYTIYGKDHPDWFMNNNSNPNSNQLNLMAGKEMEDVVFSKFCEYLTKDKKATYFMFAQQDIPSGCECDACKEAIRTWAGNYQGIQVDFLNRMIKRVQAWIDVNQPGREIYYVVFGYQHTFNVPMRLDSNGNYQYWSDRVIPDDRIRFLVAPVQGNYSFTFDDPVNADLLTELKKWNIYANHHYIVYLYDTNFFFYFVNFNNFGAITSMMRTCQEQGAYYFLTQGASNAASGCFGEMRQFVESELLWDTSLSYDDLVNEFMENYYKDAAKEMRDIYDIIRDRYAYFDTVVNTPSGNNIYANILDPNLWTYGSVRAMQKDIQDALKKIEHYQTEDFDLYQKLTNRIYKEYMTVIFIKVKLYKGNCGDEELSEMKEIWERYVDYFGFTRDSENTEDLDIFND